MAPGPERKNSSFGSQFKKGLDFIFEKHKKPTSIAAVIIIPLLTYGVFSMESSEDMLGEKEILEIIKLGSDVTIDPDVIDEYVETTDSIGDAGDLSEGSSKTLTIPSNETSVIRSISISLRWTDEESMPSLRLRRFENQPDTFSLGLSYPNGTDSDSGDSGSISLDIDFTEEQMKTIFGQGNFSLLLTLDNAGDWEPGIGIGLISVPDNGNSYELTIEIVYLVPKE